VIVLMENTIMQLILVNPAILAAKHVLLVRQIVYHVTMAAIWIQTHANLVQHNVPNAVDLLMVVQNALPIDQLLPAAIVMMVTGITLELAKLVALVLLIAKIAHLILIAPAVRLANT
jgi:hypothetical protein